MIAQNEYYREKDCSICGVAIIAIAHAIADEFKGRFSTDTEISHCEVGNIQNSHFSYSKQKLPSKGKSLFRNIVLWL